MSSLNTSIDAKLDSILSKLYSTLIKPKDYATAAAAGNNQSVVVPVVAPVVAPVVVQSITHAPAPCEVLVLNPTGQNVSSVSLDDIKKSVTKKLKNVQMTFITANDNSKKISLGFPNYESRDDGATVINQIMTFFLQLVMNQKMLVNCYQR